MFGEKMLHKICYIHDCDKEAALNSTLCLQHGVEEAVFNADPLEDRGH